MRNLFILMRVYVFSFLGQFIKKRKEAKYSIAILLMGLFAVFMIYTFSTNAVATTLTFLELSEKVDPSLKQTTIDFSMYFSCVMSVMMIFFLTLFRATTPRKTNDSELLLSLPLKKREIILSKLFYNYLFDLLMCLGLLFPSFVVYKILVPGASSLIIVRGMILTLIIPVLSNIIAIFIGSIFDRIASMFRNYSIIQAILVVILLVIYLFFYFSLSNTLAQATDILLIESSFSNIWPVKIMAEYVLNGNFTYFLIIALTALILAIPAIYLKAHDYNSEKKVRVNTTKSSDIVQSKPLKILFKKELRYYFSTTIYLVNTIIGIIFYLIIVGLITFSSFDKINMYLSSFSNSLGINGSVIVVLALTFSIGTFVTTGSAISLEGKRFWILKAHPIKPEMIFVSKILVNLVISGIAILISIPAILSLDWLDYKIWAIILPILATIFSSCLGLLINILFPKLEWDSEEVPVKQSIASLMALFVPVIILIIPFVVYLSIFKNISFNLFGLIIMISYVIFNILIIMILKTIGVKSFNKI